MLSSSLQTRATVSPAQHLCFWLTVFCVAALPLAAPALAVDRAATERAFRQWLVTDIWPDAQAAGVSRKTFDAALGGITLDWDLPELVPPGTSAPHTVEAQAEFRSPGAYFNQANLNAQAAIGRQQLAKWSKTVAAIEQRFGVPGEILVAIWAREFRLRPCCHPLFGAPHAGDARLHGAPQGDLPARTRRRA